MDSLNSPLNVHSEIIDKEVNPDISNINPIIDLPSIQVFKELVTPQPPHPLENKTTLSCLKDINFENTLSVSEPESKLTASNIPVPNSEENLTSVHMPIAKPEGKLTSVHIPASNLEEKLTSVHIPITKSDSKLTASNIPASNPEEKLTSAHIPVPPKKDKIPSSVPLTITDPTLTRFNPPKPNSTTFNKGTTASNKILFSKAGKEPSSKHNATNKSSLIETQRHNGSPNDTHHDNPASLQKFSDKPAPRANKDNFNDKTTLSEPQLQTNIPLVTGDKILTNLQTASQNAGTQIINYSQSLQGLKSELVDQILIANNTLNNKQTVKIILSPQLLPNTEVNLQKQENNLKITFVTTFVQSENFLTTTQFNLQTHLADRFTNFQEISVSVIGPKGTASTNSQGQPQEGRSRNRYEYQTEDNE